ncbi:hypothetical protein NEFER03_1831 [Nematocida sp. LUAm3]|nr:hypothetical protein NEFER03_1831 [Nematocida sp. LUAm3]KAI5173862.1 hypothetical protein NEFER02_0329 [Nematocida sp. LUAm2]KAI5177393.1 hypothetical protein NEFER01_0668 [Nematocida sp. LUAm1]
MEHSSIKRKVFIIIGLLSIGLIAVAFGFFWFTKSGFTLQKANNVISISETKGQIDYATELRDEWVSSEKTISAFLKKTNNGKWEVKPSVVFLMVKMLGDNDPEVGNWGLVVGKLADKTGLSSYGLCLNGNKNDAISESRMYEVLSKSSFEVLQVKNISLIKASKAYIPSDKENASPRKIILYVLGCEEETIKITVDILASLNIKVIYIFLNQCSLQDISWMENMHSLKSIVLTNINKEDEKEISIKIPAFEKLSLENLVIGSMSFKIDKTASNSSALTKVSFLDISTKAFQSLKDVFDVPIDSNGNPKLQPASIYII